MHAELKVRGVLLNNLSAKHNSKRRTCITKGQCQITGGERSKGRKPRDQTTRIRGEIKESKQENRGRVEKQQGVI